MTAPAADAGLRSHPFERLHTGLRAIVLLGSAWHLGVFVVLVCMRVGYPFELEWLEGAMVDHVRTILAGEPLYAKPSLRFIPLTYTPGYFYLGAAASAVFGIGFLPLRLISIAASLALIVVIGRLASREAGDARAGVLAAGLFAAMYGWTDGWLDLARNDSLFLLLAFLAIAVLRERTSTAAAAAAGALVSLSFFVKQTGLLVAIPLALYAAWRGRRAFAAYAGTAAVLIGAGSLALDRAFDGWYAYYVFAVPKQHPLAAEMWWGFWRYDLLRPLPVALAGSLAYAASRLSPPHRDAGVFYVCAGAGLFGGALASRLHSLSYVNVVLPAYAALAVMFAVAVFVGGRTATGGGAPRRRMLPSLLYLLAILQLARLGYAPSRLVPAEADVEAGRALLRAISAVPGEVFLPYHGYLPSLAGKETHAHAVVIADVIRGGVTETERDLAAELEEALRTGRFQAVVSVEAPTPVRAWLPVERHYDPLERVIDRRSPFWRPEIRYTPRQGPPPAASR